jgi:sulfopropanediol 3-dehydrogenase
MSRMQSLGSKLEYIKSPAARTVGDLDEIESTVRGILRAVRDEGDIAVRRYSKIFDNYDGRAFEVGAAERVAALAALDAQTRNDTEFAIAQVRAFAEAQRAAAVRLTTHLDT